MVRQSLRDDDSVEPSSEAMSRAKAIFAQRAMAPSAASNAAAWLENAQRFIARLVYDSRVQPAAVRFAGQADRINLSFETETGEIDVQAERLPEEERDGPWWRVVGQISDATAGRSEIALARRGSNDALLGAATDEHGGVSLETLPGEYDLLIRAAREAALERVIVLSPLGLP
jgi:hypothetical protein